MAEQEGAGTSGRRGRLLVRSAVAGAGTAVAAGAALSALATYVARQVVTPPDAVRPDDIEVLGVGAGTLTLRADADTVAQGRYGLWLDGGAAHVRVGEIVDHDEQARTVTRRLLGVDHGRIRQGPARWNQYYYAGTPRSALDLPFEEVTVEAPVGPLPAWYVPAGSAPAAGPQGSAAHDGRTWAILVHGRGATREECLRALPVLGRLGLPALVVSYRNDHDAVPSPRGRYHLGESEWLDVEAAVLHASQQGASDVVLIGWSMGAAIALQLVSRSWTRDRVRALVLDAPVLDWRDVLDHHAQLNGIPVRLGRLSQALLGHVHARHLAALEMPVALDRMDWVARAGELRHPMLVVHSEDDEFVPCGPSRRLAAARPDLVTLVAPRGARHTKEWNVDPDGWDTAVARFLLSV